MKSIRFIIKKLFIILFLIVNLQSYSLADNIKEFELEGISIGDSLLKFIPKNEIKKRLEYHKEQGNNKKVGHITNILDSEQFVQINASIKTNDKNYKIISITGYVDIESDIKKCEAKKSKIVSEISDIFNETEKWDTGNKTHEFDETSTYNGTVFEFDTGSSKSEFIRVQCYDWSKETGYDDQLRLEIVSRDYYEWLSSLQR